MIKIYNIDEYNEFIDDMYSLLDNGYKPHQKHYNYRGTRQTNSQIIDYIVHHEQICDTNAFNIYIYISKDLETREKEIYCETIAYYYIFENED